MPRRRHLPLCTGGLRAWTGRPRAAACAPCPPPCGISSLLLLLLHLRQKRRGRRGDSLKPTAISCVAFAGPPSSEPQKRVSPGTLQCTAGVSGCMCEPTEHRVPTSEDM